MYPECQTTKKSDACCGQVPYNSARKICCLGQLHRANGELACCGAEVIRKHEFGCCSDQVYQLRLENMVKQVNRKFNPFYLSGDTICRHGKLMDRIELAHSNSAAGLF